MEYINLNELCDINIGKTPSRSKPEYWGEGKKWLAISDLKEKYIYETKEEITKLAIEKCNMKMVPKDTVVMSFKLSIGKLGIVKDDMFTNEAIANFKIKNKSLITKEFLYYALMTVNFNNTDRAVMGATLNKAKLNTIKIPYFEVRVQDKIVNTLNKAKELIDKRKEQIEALDELVKSKFIEMFGDPYLNPKGWEVNNYEEICNFITDGEHTTPKRCDEGIYLLSARNVLNHSLQLDDVDFIDEDEYIRISKRIVPEENDILISCSGSVGRVCKVPKNFKFQMVRSVAILKLNENINATFMEWLIDSNYTQQQILKSINQSSQANLFQGKIKQLKAIVPPMELQNQFADFVKQIDKLKFEMEKSLKELEDNFNSLMQRAFNGELF